jgi:hypothetical protein
MLMSGKELIAYVDSHASPQFLPARMLGDVDAKARRLGLTVAVKPWRGNSGPDQLNLVLAGLDAARTAFMTFTDGSVLEVANLLVNSCFDVARGAPAHVSHVLKLADSAYLEQHGLAGAIYLHPGTISYARRVAHTPREELAGWRVFLVVFLTPQEYELGKRDSDRLFEQFERVHRDLMTVHAPYTIPA